MLEEIKKELLKLNIHECDIEDVFEILDKHNNQPDYKKLVEHLKTLRLGTQELDYNYEDEPILNFEYFDWDYYIENWFEVEKYKLGGE